MSVYIIAIALGWVIAQLTKYCIAVIRGKNLQSARMLYFSGGMPSAHSASCVALATLIGMRNGFESPLFALALLFASVVMYDAIMVRRSVGVLGMSLSEVRQQLKYTPIARRIANGHTPLEVFAGAVLGLVIAIVVNSTSI